MALEGYGGATGGWTTFVSCSQALGLFGPLLMLELRRANWETRHGASLGLKEILKLQGGGGGQLGSHLYREQLADF